jgi:hypothetical protein
VVCAGVALWLFLRGGWETAVVETEEAEVGAEPEAAEAAT